MNNRAFSGLKAGPAPFMRHQPFRTPIDSIPSNQDAVLAIRRIRAGDFSECEFSASVDPSDLDLVWRARLAGFELPRHGLTKVGLKIKLQEWAADWECRYEETLR